MSARAIGMAFRARRWYAKPTESFGFCSVGTAAWLLALRRSAPQRAHQCAGVVGGVGMVCRRGGRCLVGELRGMIGHLRRRVGVNTTCFPLHSSLSIARYFHSSHIPILCRESQARTLKKGCRFHGSLEYLAWHPWYYSYKLKTAQHPCVRRYERYEGPRSKSPRVSLLLERSIALSSTIFFGAGAGAGGSCATQNFGYCR